MVNFIGLGAQKSGTSWLYACLYEHPEVYAPIKELHFFSRERYQKGVEWYMDHFTSAPRGTISGEFSTSYLDDQQTPARIAKHFPDVKMIAILRNPVDRVFSDYRNAVKAGEITKGKSFSDFIKTHTASLERGKYSQHLQRYYEYFSPSQIHVAIYEDSLSDPKSFVQGVYIFLGISPSFVPSMLMRTVNTARTPHIIWVDRWMHTVAEKMRSIGFDRLVFYVKRSGLTDIVRKINTTSDERGNILDADYKYLRSYYQEDVATLSSLLGRDLCREWDIIN